MMVVNLHERYNHYLHTDKRHDHVNERVISYGWTDDGKNITGYYVLTENYKLFYDMKERLESMEEWKSD